MSADRISAVEALLSETEAAHGAYEAADLGGVYDQDWPAWYAAYAEFEQTEPKAEPWQTFVARRIVDAADR
jgi:hypothetical protein